MEKGDLTTLFASNWYQRNKGNQQWNVASKSIYPVNGTKTDLSMEQITQMLKRLLNKQDQTVCAIKDLTQGQHDLYKRVIKMEEGRTPGFEGSRR